MVKALQHPFFWLCVGMCVRVAYAWAFGDPLAASDAPGYYADALHLLRGEAYVPQFPPGLPLLLAGWMAVFGTGKVAVTACMIAVYAAFGWGLMRVGNPYPQPPSPRKGALSTRWRFILLQISERLRTEHTHWHPFLGEGAGGRGNTWLPMLLFALFPAAIHQSIAPLTHLLLAACLVWAWEASGNRKRPWMAGLMVGFAILVRPASALAGLVMGWRLSSFGDGPVGPAQDDNFGGPGINAVMLSRPRGPSPKHDLFRFLLPALALPGLWLAFTALTLGRPVLNEYNAYNFFLGNNPHTPLYETWWLGSHEAVDSVGFAQYTASLHPGGTPTPDDYNRAAWQHIADLPDLFVVRTLARMRTLLAFDTLAAGDWRDRHPDSRFYLVLLAADALIGIGILLFGGLGLMVSLFRREKAPPYKGAGGDVFLLLLALVAPYWLAFSHPTYHLPLLPFLALFVVEGGRKYLSLKWLQENPRLALTGGVYALALLAIQAEWVLRRG